MNTILVIRDTLRGLAYLVKLMVRVGRHVVSLLRARPRGALTDSVAIRVERAPRQAHPG